MENIKQAVVLLQVARNLITEQAMIECYRRDLRDIADDIGPILLALEAKLQPKDIRNLIVETNENWGLHDD
jgi:hypothetical protein